MNNDTQDPGEISTERIIKKLDNFRLNTFRTKEEQSQSEGLDSAFCITELNPVHRKPNNAALNRFLQKLKENTNERDTDGFNNGLDKDKTDLNPGHKSSNQAIVNQFFEKLNKHREEDQAEKLNEHKNEQPCDNRGQTAPKPIPRKFIKSRLALFDDKLNQSAFERSNDKFGKVRLENQCENLHEDIFDRFELEDQNKAERSLQKLDKTRLGLFEENLNGARRKLLQDGQLQTELHRSTAIKKMDPNRLAHFDKELNESRLNFHRRAEKKNSGKLIRFTEKANQNAFTEERNQIQTYLNNDNSEKESRLNENVDQAKFNPEAYTNEPDLMKFNCDIDYNENQFNQQPNLNEVNLLPNEHAESFSCLICCDDVDEDDGFTLDECRHKFCRSCVREHIIAVKKAEIKCPYMDNNCDCPAAIQQREIKELLTDEEFVKYEKLLVRDAKMGLISKLICPNEGCSWFAERTAGALAVQYVECPGCSSIICTKCLAIHPDLDCDEYQRKLQGQKQLLSLQKKIQEGIDKGELMLCPGCNISLKKDEGCDWIRCPHCYLEICWVTKQRRWGPNGKGDTSAGCKCRSEALSGQPCHPNCKYCH